MGGSSSQSLAELTEEDIEFISSRAKIDHESVKVWYDKLKVSLSAESFRFHSHFPLQAACPNGKISKSDTVSFLRSINSGKEEQIDQLAADIHKAFDANNDGIVGKTENLSLEETHSFNHLDLREFLIGFALTSTGSVREKLKYVFRTYDHDHNGVINKKEIDRMVKVCFRHFLHIELSIWLIDCHATSRER